MNGYAARLAAELPDAWRALDVLELFGPEGDRVRVTLQQLPDTLVVDEFAELHVEALRARYEDFSELARRHIRTLDGRDAWCVRGEFGPAGRRIGGVAVYVVDGMSGVTASTTGAISALDELEFTLLDVVDRVGSLMPVDELMLSTDELTVIAWIFGVAAFPAASTSSLARLDPDARQAALLAIVRSLTARGVVDLADGEPSIREEYRALLEGALFSNLLIKARTVRSGGVEESAWSVSNEHLVAVRGVGPSTRAVSRAEPGSLLDRVLNVTGLEVAGTWGPEEGPIDRTLAVGSVELRCTRREGINLCGIELGWLLDGHDRILPFDYIAGSKSLRVRPSGRHPRAELLGVLTPSS